MAEVEEEDIGLEVGDTVAILGGKLNKTTGKLYGFSSDRIAILPKGTTDRILPIPLIDGEPDPELGIEEIVILKKAPRPGFINMVDMRAGQTVETFDADADSAGVFKVLSVNEEEDSAVLENEAGDQEEITFAFAGIPRDLPYEVMRTREAPVSEAAAPAEPTEPAGPVSLVEVDETDALEEQVPSLEEDKAEVAAVSTFALGEAIELPAEEELKEIGTADRIYDDFFQRSDMLSQLIRLLPPTQQRDPVKLQEVRRFVEQMLILRNEVVKYGPTGDPAGVRSTSLTTLAELITRPDVSLSRKVVDISRVLTLNHSLKHTADVAAGGEGTDIAPGSLTDGLFVVYRDTILERAEKLQSDADVAQANPTITGATPKFFLDMERYRQQIQTPYIFETEGQPTEKDEEVFRREIPNTEEPELNALQTPTGIMSVFNPPPIEQIPFAITRILKERKVRLPSGLRTIEPAEAPSYTNILVFPLQSQRDLGPIRSGVLAQDMSLGAMCATMMDDILERLGEISDFPTADSILNLGVKGNIIGNVTIKEWLSSLRLRINGAGDVFQRLRGYGTQSIEFNAEQMAVIQGKVENRLAALRIFMAKEREAGAASQANLKFEPQMALKPEDAARLLARIESEPLLQKMLEEVRLYMGELAASDMNWFIYIFNIYPDLLLATLGQQAHTLTRERLRHVRDLYIKATLHGYTIKRNLQLAGQPPEENTCRHVKALLDIRKATVDSEPKDVTRIKLLVKLLNDFRGRTEDNWVWCNVCDKHLICAHELMHIQEFLRPAEEETLHKEMIIKFSGGQFSGKFICRVCGQTLADMDFDTSLEFDDEGRPMMGRSVMVDREAIELEKLNDLLQGNTDIVEDVKMGNDSLNEMYAVLKKIASLLGVNPEEADYRSMVENLSTYISGLPTRDSYAAATKGKKAQDYDIYYSVRYVSAAAAILLLNVQTHVPDYIVYYTSADCKDGFLGYPLESEEKQSGIQCIASVVANINDNEFPWNMTTLQKQTNLVKRRDMIQPLIKGQIDSFMKFPNYQTLLKRKRDYLTKFFGKVGGGAADVISDSFRPIPYILTEEDAAAAPVMAAGATPDKQAVAWIRQAHAVARRSAALNPDAPLTETTCCLRPVLKMDEFWTTQGLPSLEPRRLAIREGSLTTTFYTEKPKTLEGKIEAKDYYKLFVYFCYQGDNKGLPHKLGLTLSCSECGLHFKTNPRLPLTLEGNPNKAAEAVTMAAAELQAYIVSQGIVINEETAQDILTTAHYKTHIEPQEALVIPKQDDTFASLAEFSPIEEWPAMLNSIQNAMRELGAGPTRIQVAKVAEELVAAVSVKEAFIRSRIGEKVFPYIESLTRKTPRECGEAISSFILVPFQRWLTGLDADTFKIQSSYELSFDTQNDIMVKGLGEYLKAVGDEQLKGLLLRKARLFVKNLSYLCQRVFPKLRGILIPGGDVMVGYLLRAYIMGVVQRYVDPHHIPESEEDLEDDGGVVNMKILYIALARALTKYAVGNKIPTEDEIRLALEKRAEKEKQVFIMNRDRMNKDQRDVDSMMQALRMGKWAKGAGRQYDNERYEEERAERAAAGIVDYVDPVRDTDMFGTNFGNDYDMGGERIDGDYTDGAMREDEY